MIWPSRKRARRIHVETSHGSGSRSTGTQVSVALHSLLDGFAASLGDSGDSLARAKCRAIAVGSGKGGVGKTLISSSIALALSEHFGQRVVAIDVDLGGANLHTGLGVKRPEFALNQFILDKVPLRDLSQSTRYRGLDFVSGASDIIGLAEFSDADRERFLDELGSFREETVVLDLGAGSSLFNLDLFTIAQQGTLVTTPEPTAVQNAYGFLRAAVFRCLRRVSWGRDSVLRLVEDAANHRGGEDSSSVPHLLWQVSKVDSAAAAQIEAAINELKIGLVINMAKTREAARLADAFAKTARRYFGVRLDFLGNVDFDTSVRRSVCEWRPLVVNFPTARASRRLASVATKVSNHFDG